MIVSTATLRGDGRKNQDAIVVSDRAAAVLDAPQPGIRRNLDAMAAGTPRTLQRG